MTTLAEVRLWGKTIGAVHLEPESDVAAFEFATDFVGSGIEVSPLAMPLQTRVYRFPDLARGSFHGLPGLLADSLPDKFGNALINTWLATQGRRPESFSAVERLCYIGSRGTGALEFRPTIGPEPKSKSAASDRIQIAELVALASTVLQQRERLAISFTDDPQQQSLQQMLQIGTSAGGARAKALVAWNPDSCELRSGQIDAGDGFEHWLIKFDGVSNNRDRELADPQGFGAVEYAYHLMATDAGIDMAPCQLLEEGGRRHFMTRRFDRSADGKKRHMQTLAAMAHYDFNLAGGYSYEQALMTIRQLGLPMETIEQQFRRMAFNIIARNQDDHVKNIAFLMDKRGRWSLSPAYDITYSYNPSGTWTAKHQMTLNGKRDDFSLEDLQACARHASMQRSRAEAIVEDVRSVVSRWPNYAEEMQIPSDWQQWIQKTLRLNIR